MSATPGPAATITGTAAAAAADWTAIGERLDDVGGALLPRLIDDEQAAEMRALYARDGLFRSTIDMNRHRFGSGEYRYFDRPEPAVIDELKHALYPRLLPIARDWWTKLRRDPPWPDSLDEWLAMCHDAGQTKSTAILLRYGAGDWNALHRDLYGDLVFPLQVVVMLSRPEIDHSGGEFLLVEQRPRAQSRGSSFTIPHGHGLVFTTRDRPIRSARGWSVAPMRHGVSTVHSGERVTLALVFHDAA
ncbi:2OG-Fe(II) oxygenase [Millisia brevis]|uniref:2OG-Fe(II) oxygenase n=1 Tax=Millisia brevis TaxID=264148 RepID=UPI000831FF13|nr:2OG-Fe(II) oxygenase [Millisia brevis]